MLADYYPLLLQVIVAAGFAVGALVFTALIGKRGRRSAAKDTAYECGMEPEGAPNPRFSVKFYLIAMLFILFDIEIVFLYPWAVVYREMIGQGWMVFGAMASFMTVLFAGFLYVWRKGALDWGR